jgi:hypothetical protein
MSILRARVPIVCAGLFMAAALAGCLGTRLKTETPAGVQLQGVWRLNRTASEDPEKAIEKMRAEAMKKIKRAMNAPPPTVATPSSGGGRHRGQQGGASAPDQPLPEDMPQIGPGMDPLRNSPTMHTLREILQRSDYLTIRQSPDKVSFDYGSTVRSYTPGGHSVVSSENGVADQTSGWDGKEYVVNIKPQLGPQVIEEYGVSPDGKQLIVKLRIGPFELSKVTLVRVYDVTSAVVPNSRPSND